MASYYAGLDLGTSGCRLVVIDAAGTVQAQTQVAYPQNIPQTPNLWWDATQQVLAALPPIIRANLHAVAVDGTSGTVLLTDETGQPTTSALMYHDLRAQAQAQRIAAVAPASSAAHGAGGSLAKALWLLEHYPDAPHAHILHQADWIAGKLAGQFGFSDANNCLKLGYDPLLGEWPHWVRELLPAGLLPTVHLPGTPVAVAAAGYAVHAGTTDSIAAFLATGAAEVGEAVTSLGSTLALKVISDRPVFAPAYGIYSHRLGNRWLAGGASNSGGAVLLHYFSRERLAELTPLLQPEQPTGLDYYPLLQPGERFPHADPHWPPRLMPRPADDAQFLQGMLEGMVRIEQLGWQRLHTLGAPYPRTLRTVGGGSRNPAWQRLRERMLGIPLLPARQQEAAYGAALLAAGRLGC